MVKVEGARPYISNAESRPYISVAGARCHKALRGFVSAEAVRCHMSVAEVLFFTTSVTWFRCYINVVRAWCDRRSYNQQTATNKLRLTMLVVGGGGFVNRWVGWGGIC